MKEKQPISLTDSIWFGMLLTVIGGIMDAYSYIVRGGVFATGQTGNFVIMALGLLSGDVPRALRALMPVMGFFLGVFAAKHVLHRLVQHPNREVRHQRWKRNVLLVEAVLMIAVGLIPDSTIHLVSNTVIAFAAALQFCSFRHFDGYSAYATVFVTGNMRSCAEKYYEGIVLKSAESRRKAFEYTGVLAAFLVGVAIAALLAPHLGIRTIWAAAVLCLVSSAWIHLKIKD
ncbi:MAG: DUF1275 domain-containing protein [Lachnospiraceae bacterium]|nr:DUF1275 domain-containing protein [Lachnospiraceae bacterium]